MTGYLLDIAIIFTLLICNSLLAMSEMALVSARKTRLMQWAESGDKNARLALDIANHPTPILSSIQIGITLAALLTGIYGGATISDNIADQISRYERFKPYADLIAITLTTTVLTYISLVIGELVPKRIALNFPEVIAKFAARPLTIFTTSVRPLVWLLTASTETIVRVLGLKQRLEPAVTEAEIHVMVEQATEAGIFEEVEQEMVASVLKLDNRRADALMTPRREIEWLDTKDTEKEWLETALNVPHSKLIVAQESLDHIIGIVETKSIIQQKFANGKIDVQLGLQQPLYVPETINALDLIQRFRESAQQIAIVLDEYGGVHGLVTREDIFEAIVGDLPMAGGADKVSIAQQQDGTWLCDGQLNIDVFKEALTLASLPGQDEDADYRTVAGFVLYQLEHVPAEGEQFTWDKYQFTVVDMDHHRIDKLQIKLIKPQSGS
jgi:putative hemolysin